MNEAETFFYHAAGYSYNPVTETPEDGRVRTARLLAEAEAAAENLTFEWEIDPDIDSSDFDDSPEPWDLWACVARNEEGNVAGSIGGVDFGRYGDPWSDDYARVIEAEIALNAHSPMAVP